MAYVSDILSRKGNHVHTVPDTVTVLQATCLMNEHHIGGLVVVDGQQQLAGLFTERDVLRRVVAARKDPERTLIRDVMTRECVTGTPEMSIAEVQQLMKHRRIRHLPVLDPQGQLVGMVSIGDVNALLSEDHEIQLQYLEEYFTRSA